MSKKLLSIAALLVLTYLLPILAQANPPHQSEKRVIDFMSPDDQNFIFFIYEFKRAEALRKARQERLKQKLQKKQKHKVNKPNKPKQNLEMEKLVQQILHKPYF
jgi:hypothetical protein